MQVALLGLDQDNRDHRTNSNWHFLKAKCNMKLLPRFVLSKLASWLIFNKVENSSQKLFLPSGFYWATAGGFRM